MARRIVVTGIGLVTPLGVGATHNWTQLTSGAVGVTRLKDAKYESIPCKVAALVPRGTEIYELNLSHHFSSSEMRTMSLGTAYALVATEEALNDSNWHPTDGEGKDRTGVAVGMGISDLDDIYNSGNLLKKKYSSISPYFIPRILTNMAAGQISIKNDFHGPNHAVSTACATGCHAIGDAFRMIKEKDADVMVCGGTEAAVSSLGMAGFCRLRALSTKYNNSPQLASRPFDKNRDGFVMGEGAGILILEELNHAVQRNARIYAEILGYGYTGDANHLTAPRSDGQGAIKAMKKCLQASGVETKCVGYINAHATSTPLGDAIEAQAIYDLFGYHSSSLQVSSNKGNIGHLLGAAGAVEAIFTLLTCHSAFIPHTANLMELEPKIDLNFITASSKPWIQQNSKRIALCNSFGFGGTNACICLASYED